MPPSTNPFYSLLGVSERKTFCGEEMACAMITFYSLLGVSSMSEEVKPIKPVTLDVPLSTPFWEFREASHYQSQHQKET